MKTHPSAFKMQPGIYYTPNDCTVSRWLFLDAIARCAPEVLIALRDDVYPQCNLSEDSPDIDIAISKVMYTCWPFATSIEIDPIQIETAQNLWNWATTFHLVSSIPKTSIATELRWDSYHCGLIRVAYNTLRDWFITPANKCNMEWKVFPRSVPPSIDDFHSNPRKCHLDIDDFLNTQKQSLFYYLMTGDVDNVPTHDAYTFSFSCPRWNPLVESRAEAKRRIQKHFDERLNDKLHKEEALLVDLGAKPWPIKVEPRHFEWLVQYQVKGHSYETIGKKVKRVRQTVTEGVHGAANMMIGNHFMRWLREPSRPGRSRRKEPV